jgi:hypothetical protein
MAYPKREIPLIQVSVRFEPADLATIDNARKAAKATRQSWLHAAALAYSSRAQVEARKPIEQSPFLETPTRDQQGMRAWK